MHKEKISKIFCVILMVMFVVSCGTVAKAASENAETLKNNHGDTWFTWYYNGDGGDNFTDPRTKEDATSAYAKNSGSQVGIRCRVLTIDCQDMSAGDCGRILPVGRAMYLPNYIYENGYRNARIRVSPDAHSPCYIEMLWSPDSV
jgi:hypothetical protein